MNSIDDINAAVGQISGGRVLDVGTAGGGMIQAMIEDLKDYEAFVGVDVNPPRSGDGDSVFDRDDVEFMQMDGHQLDLPDASFDTVIAGYSLHHMTAVEQVLAEMVRVLKPGGHIIISEVYQGEMSEQQYTHMHLHHWWARVDRALGVPHNETYTRPDLIALIDALNLRDLQLLDFNPESGDPFDAERREFLHQRAEKTYERAQDLPDFAAIKARGEELLHRLDTVGFQSAPVLVAIGRKG